MGTKKTVILEKLSYEYLYEQYRVLEKTPKEISLELECKEHIVSDCLKKFNLLYTKKELWATPKYKERQRIAREKGWDKPSEKRLEHLETISHMIRSREFMKTEEYKRKVSENTKKNWKDVTKNLWQSQEYVKKQIKARNVCPNKSEIDLQKTLDKYYPNQWKFVGDGQFKLAGKYPDFVHVTDKIVIELYGEYWHSKQEAESRVKLFSEHGYKCVIIWCSENYPKTVKQKLEEIGYSSITSYIMKT